VAFVDEAVYISTQSDEEHVCMSRKSKDESFQGLTIINGVSEKQMVTIKCFNMCMNK
jgi:hypothetical protein